MFDSDHRTKMSLFQSSSKKQVFRGIRANTSSYGILINTQIDVGNIFFVSITDSRDIFC